MADDDSLSNEASPLLEQKPKIYSEGRIFAITIGFCLSIAICGLTNMAYSDNIVGLAENVGTSSVLIGDIYIWRGVGAISGSFLFPSLSAKLSIMWTLYASFIIFIGLTVITAFCTSENLLYFIFFGSGLFGSILDTGSVSMVRTIHGANAGPWMTTIFLIFSLSGSFSLVLQMISLDIMFNFLTISAIATACLVWLFFQPDAEVFLSALQVKKEKKAHLVEHYYVEFVCAVAMFGLIGGSAVIVTYTETYINTTGVLSSTFGPMVILTYRLNSNLSKVIMAFLQAYVGTSTTSLFIQYTILSALSIIGFIAVLIWNKSGALLWVVLAMFGLTNGPGSSMVFDFTNKLTTSTEMSTSILMTGLNLGAAFPPWIASVLWTKTDLGSDALFVTMLGLTALSLVVLIAPLLSYLPSVEKQVVQDTAAV